MTEVSEYSTSASSDREAMKKIIAELERGYVLERVEFRNEGPPVRLHFRREG